MERLEIFERLLADFRETVDFVEGSGLRPYDELEELAEEYLETYWAARAELDAMRAEAEDASCNTPPT
jgi:trans-aconitate methyltransferase